MVKVKIFVNVNFSSYIGNVSFSSGRHYWEFKIDKTTNKKDNLWIGVTNN